MRVIFVRKDARQGSVFNYHNNMFICKCVVAVCRVGGLILWLFIRRPTFGIHGHIPSRIQGFVRILLQSRAFCFYVRGTWAVHVSFFQVTTRRLRTRTGSWGELLRSFCGYVWIVLFRILRYNVYFASA